jgi:hypothetical protein
MLAQSSLCLIFVSRLCPKNPTTPYAPLPGCYGLDWAERVGSLFPVRPPRIPVFDHPLSAPNGGTWVPSPDPRLWIPAWTIPPCGQILRHSVDLPFFEGWSAGGGFWGGSVIVGRFCRLQSPFHCPCPVITRILTPCLQNPRGCHNPSAL